MDNVEGVFLVLIVGACCATVLGILEWLWECFMNARENKVRGCIF